MVILYYATALPTPVPLGYIDLPNAIDRHSPN
jgi:hypothetical protein